MAEELRITELKNFRLDGIARAGIDQRDFGQAVLAVEHAPLLQPKRGVAELYREFALLGIVGFPDGDAQHARAAVYFCDGEVLAEAHLIA